MSPEAVQHEEGYNSPMLIAVITFIILSFFFLGFFSLYFCNCCMQSLLLYAWVFRRNPNANPVAGPGGPSSDRLGLDPKYIENFPSFSYSSVKGYRREKYGLECAICLVEFCDDDMLRLLPSCCHVFHQECVDLWLEKHTTCPVCRQNLDSLSISSPMKSPLSQSSLNNALQVPNESVSPEGSYSITINDENEDERGEDVSTHSCNINVDDLGGQNAGVEKYSRSYTTGHSFAKNTKDEARFTLKLPDDVKERIIKGHNISKSCTNF